MLPVDLFCGEYSIKLDDKGRMVLPAKLRGAFAEGIVICYGQEGSLEGYRIPDFKARVAREREKGKATPRDRRRLRALTAAAVDQVPDSQGRVLISPKLREHAQLGKELVITGFDDTIEIWSAERWAQEQELSATEWSTLDDSDIDK